MRRAIIRLITGLVLVEIIPALACNACRRGTDSSGAQPASGEKAASPASTSSEAQAPSGLPLEAKNYSPAANARNQAVEFSIPTFNVTKTLGSHAAPQGKVFLVIDTVWKNIIPLTKVRKHPEKQKASKPGDQDARIFFSGS